MILRFLKCVWVAVAVSVITLSAGTASAQVTPADATTPPPPPAVATSPLAIHVGDADLLIGGFMDATAVMRTTNTGNGLGTSFGTIPFGTTATGAPNPAGQMNETRFSAQNSRLTLQATSKFKGASLKGYLEADFLGNTSTNINVTSNSDTLRLRLYWVQYQQGHFEFLAGQSWSLMTPNRTGLSPAPGDLMYTQVVDTNYQMGLTWGRTLGYRFVVHANDIFTAGLALENPEQYVGSAVVLPTAFTAAEVDTGASAIGATSAVPNQYPDVIGKIALDPKTGKTHQHIDAAFVVRGYKSFNPATNTSYSATGTGESVNVVLEPVRNLRLVATNFVSTGGGRYIANTNIPDFIVAADQSLSPVKSWSGIYGAEVQAGANSLLYGYYSVANATQNTSLDTNGTTPIGFGILNSLTANKKVTEATLGITQTFFRDAKIGGMQLQVQFSNVQRTPFSVPAAVSSSAKLNMVYVNVRYILP